MFAFGPFTLDCARYQLKRNGVTILVERRVFDLLRYLIEHRDRVVGRGELLERVWTGVSVSPNSLTRAITVLRRVLEDDVQQPSWVATIHGRGYRFVGELRERSTDARLRDPFADYRRMVVGRRAEQESLTAALVGATRGESSVLLLEGEAGIGKSRLLEWCAEEALRNFVQPIVSRCREDEGAPPLWPWVEVVRRLPALLATDAGPLLSRSAPALAHLFPELEGLASPPETAVVESDPRGLRFRSYTALADLLRAAARSAPIALLFDDLHRADPSSIALLEFLAAQLIETGVLFVGSLRPGLADHEELARIARDPRCRTVPLKGLAERDVLTLLAAAAPDKSSPQLAHEIWEQTGGNAFFVHQVLPLARSGVDTSLARALPRTARKAIEQQCAALSPTSLSALRAGAVVGREISARVLAEVIEQPLDLTLNALDEALRANVLTAEADVPLSYRFAHLLVRDVLYGELGSSERTRLHARVAVALEATASDAPALAGELAHHFSSAGTLPCLQKALHYHTVAGDFAAARFAYQAAIGHYRAALDLLQALPEPDIERRCDLLTALARQTFYAGFSGNASELWLAATEQARTLGDPARLIRVALDFSAALDEPVQAVSAELTAPLLGEVIQLSVGCSPIERARLLARQARSLELCGNPDAADRAAAAALDLARETGDSLAIADALSFEVCRRYGTPDVATRVEFAAEVVEHAERVRNRSMQFSYLYHQICALTELGRIAASDLLIASYGKLAEQIRSPVNIALWHVFRVGRALMRGEWELARPLIQEARRLAEHCEPSLFHELGGMNTALEFETTGANADVLYLIQQGGTGGAWSAVRLYAYQQLDRPDLIMQEIDAEISRVMRLRVRSKRWLPAAVTLAEVISYIEDARRAAVMLEWFKGYEELHAEVAVVYYGPALLAIGALQQTVRDWPRALESLETALQMVRSVGSPPFEIRVRLHLAATLAGRREQEDIPHARQHAFEALLLAQKLGMPYLDRQARRMLASLG